MIQVCSLQPTNDYKTSVLSGLSPANILEICSRAISFWQYQMHQEASFQQAVVRSINDKNAQLQKQLENVIREANGEITLLNNKTAELGRDLELEKRRNRELQDVSRERDKEYQKLKIQHDKIKRKALFPSNLPEVNGPNFAGSQKHEEPQVRSRAYINGAGNTVNIGDVVGGMEANGIQRTPIVARTAGSQFNLHQGASWNHQPPIQSRNTNAFHRQQFAAPPLTERSHRSGNTSDHSESANEVENILAGYQPGRGTMNNAGWSGVAQNPRSIQRSAPPRKKVSGTFRPAVPH